MIWRAAAVSPSAEPADEDAPLLAFDEIDPGEVGRIEQLLQPAPGAMGQSGLGVHAVQLIGRKMRLLRRQFATRGRQLRPRLAMARLRALGQPARPINSRAHRAQHLVKMGLLFSFYARGSSIGVRIGICACRPKQGLVMFRIHGLLLPRPSFAKRERLGPRRAPFGKPERSKP